MRCHAFTCSLVIPFCLVVELGKTTALNRNDALNLDVLIRIEYLLIFAANCIVILLDSNNYFLWLLFIDLSDRFYRVRLFINILTSRALIITIWSMVDIMIAIRVRFTVLVIVARLGVGTGILRIEV